MNKPNPLVPQGALPNSAGKGASNVRIAVVTIIAIHVVFFGGLLMQGCKRDTNKKDAAADTGSGPLTLPVLTNNNTNLPESTPPTNAAAPDTNYATPGSLSNISAAPANNIVSNTEPIGGATSATGQTKEYTVARNDTLSKIAKANHTSISAISKANPGLDPAKLKIGQKIQVPVGAPAGAATGGGATTADNTAAATTGGSSVHVVKAGETLTKIAKQTGTSVKALRAANGLKTDRVVPGQKLKVPAHTATSGVGGPAAGTHTNSH